MAPRFQSDKETLDALVEHLKESLAQSKGLKHGLTEQEGGYIDGRESAMESLIEWIGERRPLPKKEQQQ